VSEYQPGEAWARDQDRADPLAWCRGRFALPVDEAGLPRLYFAGNSLGPMPLAARDLVEAELEAWSRLGVAGHLEGPAPWYSYHETVRDSLARMVGARPHEVVAMNSLTVNLHLLLVSLYRPSGRRGKVLLEATPFPSDAYAIETHLATRGIGADQIITATPESLGSVLASHGEEIAIVWLSGVHYYTGSAPDLEALTRAAHHAGCLVGVDLAHAIGNVELRLHDWNVDGAVWCSYKYLNAGPGAVGGFYLHERYATDPELPRFGGWWGNDPATRFAMQASPRFVPVPSADGWQLSNPPIFSVAPLRASLALFDAAGMDRLRQKSVRLTGYLEFLLDRLGADRVGIVTPRDPARRGCQLSLRVPSPRPEAVVTALEQRGIVTDFRDPDVIRVAPVPLYNTFHEVWRLAAALDELLPPR
jgi:kynureninase